MTKPGQNDATVANVGERVAALFAGAGALGAQLAPLDLAGVPVYVVPQSRLPADLGGASVCDGYTSPSLDLHLRRVIGRAWRGRGACMVINDLTLGVCHFDDLPLHFHATVLHELAHVLERHRPFSHRPGVRADVLRREARQVAAAVSVDASPAELALPHLHHGAAFIRIALHLSYRAGALGVEAPAPLVLSGIGYRLSPTRHYVEALGGEPDRLLTARFRDLLDVPAPAEFLDLWHDDVLHWFRSQPPRSTA